MSLAMVMLDGLIAGIDMGSEIPVQKSELVGLKTVLELELANRRASPASVPEGYALVPVEPTQEMVEAGCKALGALYGQYGASEAYKAMFTAAPTPPVSEDRKDAERYRWLRSQQIDLNTPHLGVLNRGIFIGKIPDNVVLSDEDADAAIDAAMEGKR